MADGSPEVVSINRAITGLTATGSANVDSHVLAEEARSARDASLRADVLWQSCASRAAT